jgi:hypothetical protein
MPRSSKWYLPSRFSDQNFVHISDIVCAYIPHAINQLRMYLLISLFNDILSTAEIVTGFNPIQLQYCNYTFYILPVAS